MNALEEKVKQCIIREVFVRRNDARFVPETANWIMDFRRICLDPEFLDVYTDIFFERFKDRYPFQVGGMEVAAIPLVAAIIMKMRERGKPVNGFFIRKSRKKTGLLKMIEGKLTDAPVVLIDDLINTGTTIDRQLKVLEASGKKVMTYFTILRFRRLESYQRYRDEGIAIEALFGLDEFTADLGTKLLDTKGSVITKERFQVKWYFKAPDALLEAVVPKSGVVFDEKRVYSGSDRGILFALSRSDGSVMWTHRIGMGPWGSKRDKEIFSTPVLFDGRLYFGAYDGNVYCVEAITGKRLWVSFEADWIAGSPVADTEKKILYVPTIFGNQKDRGGLVAIDMLSGKARWRTRFPSAVRSTPLFVKEKRTIYVGSENGMFFALESAEGKIRWSFQSGGSIKDAPVYDQASQAIIFTSFDGGVYCLSASTGALLWKFDIGLPNYSSPCLWEDRVFVASLDKNLYCLDRKTGTRRWIFPARARIFSRPVVFRKRLYFGSNEARMREIDPETGKETGYFQCVERITNPVVYDGVVGEYYLQTYANEIYCLTERGGENLTESE
ncbi:MAG: PQQ-binding-like beta-propeller repeat protein [Candidatus Moranbacteria bacterium]|nr:PQQ-binding-like beta-propeller repeat protein [Candidatus Moranbacteria bacterium]